MSDLVEDVARALASADGLDWDEVCGMDADPDEGYCDSWTCVAVNSEDHDAEQARRWYLHLACAAITTLEADKAALETRLRRTMQDHGRMLWRDDVDAHCPSPEVCFENADSTVRCSPCANKQADAAGVEPFNVGRPYSPQECRLQREKAALVARVVELEKSARDAIRLVDEVNERVTSRDFYGISQTLHAKLATIRATIARAALNQEPK